MDTRRTKVTIVASLSGEGSVDISMEFEPAIRNDGEPGLIEVLAVAACNAMVSVCKGDDNGEV